jgi:hypothetical protein
MSNLLDKASILLTPTAIAASKLMCIKPNTAVGDFDFFRTSTATRTNSSGLIESVASGVPRIDYTGGGCGTWLLEQPSTNLVRYSQDFTISSSTGTSAQQNATTAASSSPSPDGLTNAFSLIYDGTFNGSIKKVTPVNANTDITFSIFLKKTALTPTFPSNSAIKMAMFNNVVSNVTLNLGDILNAAPVGEWRRYSVTGRSSATGGAVIPNVRCDVAASVDAFGWQLEDTKFMTSYIPTTTASVLRTKDIAKQAGDSSLINPVEGTLYIEFKAPTAIPQNFTRLMTISDGGAADQNAVLFMRMGANNNPNQLRAQVKVGSVGKLSVDWTIGDITSYNKLAFRYKSGESKVFVNGTQQGTTKTATFTLPTLDRFNLCNATGSENFEGNIKCAALFNEALSDVELACLTS